jgi:hypothetical protein
MTDLTTMKPVVSSFSNKPVPDAFLDAASVGFESLAKTRRKYRKFQKRCSRAGAAISRWLGR